MEPQDPVFKRESWRESRDLCVYLSLYAGRDSAATVGAVLVLPRSPLGFHHCLKETSLLPDKNVNKLLVMNLSSAVRIEAVALKETCW